MHVTDRPVVKVEDVVLPMAARVVAQVTVAVSHLYCP